MADLTVYRVASSKDETLYRCRTDAIRAVREWLRGCDAEGFLTLEIESMTQVEWNALPNAKKEADHG